MGRADDAHVHSNRTGRAERNDLAGLEHAQQLGLSCDGHVANLVEQERSTLRAAEDAQVGSYGAREGPALVPEELALDQARWDRGAVDGNQRSPSAAGRVERSRHQLLAGAGFARNEDGRIGGRQRVHAVHDPSDRRAADEPTAGFGRGLEGVGEMRPGVAIDECEEHVADPYDVATAQRAFGHAFAVDVDPISTAHVTDANRSPRVRLQGSVHPRHGRLIDHPSTVRGLASDQDGGRRHHESARDRAARGRVDQYKARAGATCRARTTFLGHGQGRGRVGHRGSPRGYRHRRLGQQRRWRIV